MEDILENKTIQRTFQNCLCFQFSFKYGLLDNLPFREKIHSAGDEDSPLAERILPTVLPKAWSLLLLFYLGNEFPLQCERQSLPLPGAEHAASAGLG